MFTCSFRYHRLCLLHHLYKESRPTAANGLKHTPTSHAFRVGRENMLVSAKVQVKRIRSSTISCDRRSTTNASLLQKNIALCWKRMASSLTNDIFCGMISNVPSARLYSSRFPTPHCAPLRFACVGLLRFRAFGTRRKL